MSTRVRESLSSGIGQLRHEPAAKRIRAVVDGVTAVDSTRALLLWEPRRVVPSYAVPAGDVRGELVPASAQPVSDIDDIGAPLPDISHRPVLDPSIPFTVHTADGDPVDVRVDGRSRPAAGFRLADPDLAGYVVLDWSAFDAWYEEDVAAIGHPKDPFHRIDVLPSSRHVRIDLDGELLAESTGAHLLFETMLPTRYYLPRADVRAELLASDRLTYCAYKGQASYWSPSSTSGSTSCSTASASNGP